MASPDSKSTTVAGVHIDVQDNAVEGQERDVVVAGKPRKVTYPTLRELWPQAAHAPAVLGFKSEPAFNTLSPEQQRTRFAKMAHDLAFLGKGARVRGVAGTLPDRSNAYIDAIAMGESASQRAYFLGTGEGPSSCGMFVRSLYKMIGVQDPSYDLPYKAQAAMATEKALAKKVGAWVNPGDPEDGTDPQNKNHPKTNAASP